MTGRWPWPGDTATDRARRIANSALDEVPEPTRTKLIELAHALGETWLGATLMRWTPDDTITSEQAAQLVHVAPATIRKWRSRGHLHANQDGHYKVSDVLACAAARRQRRGAA